MNAERIEELRAYVKSGREGGWTLTSFEIADREMIAELLDEIERLRLLADVRQTFGYDNREEIGRLNAKIGKIREAIEDAQFCDNDWLEAKYVRNELLKVCDD